MLEEFTQLEEEHHEHRFGEFSLCSRQEAYEQGSDGGDTHQEVFVEHFAFHYSLYSLADYVVADEKEWHEINQQQLPHLEPHCLFYCHGNDEQHRGKYDSCEFFLVHIYMF